MISYYNNDNNDIDENEADIIYKDRFEYYCKSMKIFGWRYYQKNLLSFWKLLDNKLVIYNGNTVKRILFIIDHYIVENDENNELYSLEKKLFEDNNMDNIKFLIVSTIKDMGVKDDFIGILKQCSNKRFKENI